MPKSKAIKRHQVLCALTRLACLLIIGFYFLLQAPVASAQAPKLKFSHINSFQGLSNSTVEAIYQDNRKFMWFGTRDGLNKYDGYQVTVFKNLHADTTSISDNFVRCLAEDSRHNLWIGTPNGLNRFDPYKNNFTRYKHSELNKAGISNSGVNCIYSDKKGDLWIGTDDGCLNLYEPTSNSFKHFYSKANKNQAIRPINYIYEDKKGTFWIGTGSGLKIFDRLKEAFISVPAIDGLNELSYPVNRIQEDNYHRLWLGTENSGLFMVDLVNKNLKQYQHKQQNDNSLANNQIRSLLVDKKGNVWAGGINGGLSLFDPTKNGFHNYQNISENSSSLSQRTVSAIFEDDQSNLWVGTHRGGVNLYTPKADKFRLLQNEPDSKGLSYNDVKAFCEDDKHQIWICTDGGGVNVWDPVRNSFRYYRYNSFNSNSLGSDAVLDILMDKNKAWISTWGGGLNCLDRETGHITRFTNNPADKTSISSSYVQKSFKDSEGNFWVATYYGGLNKFNQATHQFNRFVASPDHISKIQGNNIVSIAEDFYKNLWIGTDDGGLNCYNLRTKKITHYFTDEERMPDLRVIFTDHKGRLWVGQVGLYLFNYAKNQFNIYTTKAGLSTDFVKGIAEDHSGNFWISGSNGLIKFNPDNYNIIRYNTADGLQGQEFEANSCLTGKNGNLYFGGVNGFNVFNPDAITANPYVPPVYITGLQLFDKMAEPNTPGSPLSSDISLTRSATLNHEQSTIAFYFAALNYTAAENNKYSYLLAGFDPKWYASTDRKATYTNLPPGTYTFMVRAANNDGLWNTVGTSLILIVAPPFWATWWFRLAVIIVTLFCTYSILKFKKNLDLRKIEESKREEIHQLQLQFFTNISHEFRTPLSLILGPLEALLEKGGSATRQYYEVMYRNANRLLLLINELMDFRKVESGVLKLKTMPGNLNTFVAELTNEFEDAAYQKNIRLNLALGENIGNAYFDREILEKILLNLLNNALKYTPVSGKVTVSVFTNLDSFNPLFENELILKNSFRAGSYAFIRISDNGIGISKDSIQHLFERYYRITETHLGSGIGLAFVKSLTVLHKGDIYVYSQRNAGTDVIIGLPIGESDYTAAEKWVPANENGGTRLESIQIEEPVVSGSLYPTLANAVYRDHKYKILLVEDNEEIRAFIANSLQAYYHIIQAADGRSGLSRAKAEFPDLIISDVMMPDMDGIDLCLAIKDDIEMSHIPFVMLTAKTNLQAEIAGVNSGADLYIAKPVSINLLLLNIRNIFEQRQKVKDHYIKAHHIEARELVNSAKDKVFVDKLLSIIEQELSNTDLDVELLCTAIGMSRTKLYHKIKDISGQAPNEFIRSIRLKKAIEIMTQEDILLTEVIYRVGIQTQSYFTKAFKKEYGKTPTQYIQGLQAGKRQS